FTFIFQAEDGIRYLIVTGVQTCALPISDLVNVGADIKAFAAQHAEIDLGQNDPVDCVAIYVDEARLALHHFSLARQLIQRHAAVDRKSTRLNSSHDQISYAVFCLKKKNK